MAPIPNENLRLQQISSVPRWTLSGSDGAWVPRGLRG